MVADGAGHGHRVVDAVGYAVAVTLAVFLAGVAIKVAGGSDWFVVELVMFFLGWLLIAFGTYYLNPDPPWSVTRDEGGSIRITTDSASTTTREETAFERAVRRVPPIRWYPIPPEERFSKGAKLFLSGIVVLVASIALERLIVV